MRKGNFCNTIDVLEDELVVRAVGCVVTVSVRGSEGRRFDTQVHQLSDQ